MSDLRDPPDAVPRCGRWRAATAFAIALALAAVAAISAGPPGPVVTEPSIAVSPEQVRRIRAMGWPGAPPPDPTNRWADSDAAAALGQALFFDRGLSSNGAVSCATCHRPDRGFSDGLRVAVGVGTGPRRTMTVLDSAHQSWLGWDGRADSLWSQALQPIERDIELGSSRRSALARVSGNPLLRQRWQAAFGEPLQLSEGASADEVDAAFAMLGKAIAAYERRLVTGPSAFDRWVATWKQSGAPAALQPDEHMSPSALRGLVLFSGRAGCWQCHGGPMLSDGEFHALGAPGRPERGGGVSSDPGRYGGVDVLKSSPFTAARAHSDAPSGAKAKIVQSLVRVPDHFGAMRTPSLRHAGLGGPFFHEGQFDTLEDVVRFYSTLEGAQSLDHHQEQVLVRLDLSAGESSDLVAFLRSASGSAPATSWTSDPWSVPPPAPERPANADKSE
ncbi:MAG: methylamine utilization protein [Phycisphaerales bacterium]|nr:methylamine utilization protein [Phycisphaerales bacterium]